MKNKIMTVAAIVVAGLTAAPTASAAHGPAWQKQYVSKDLHIEWQASSSSYGGGWCDHGKPSVALAFRTTDGTTKTIYGLEIGSTLKAQTNRNITVTPRGVVVSMAFPGAGKDQTFAGWMRAADRSPNAGSQFQSLFFNPSSCAGLPTTLPGLPTGWAASTRPAKQVHAPGVFAMTTATPSVIANAPAMH